tara:strand:+ start:1674 stop:2126 length:453 start_codon:yes stop_codon:yes gene_type:complete
MNDIKESLFQALNEIVEKENMRVVNISISGVSKNPNIQIIIDSEDGVNLDDCSFVSKVTSDLININNYFADDFNLEVSSPGINRQLFTIEDYVLYIGSLVKIKLKKQINNQKNFLGKIRKVESETVTISANEREIEIEFDNIKKANIKEI